MAIRVTEDWTGDALAYGTGGASDGLDYHIHGADSKYEAWHALADYTPALWLGMIRSNIEVSLVGPKHFRGKVQYSSVSGVGGAETPVGETPPDPSGPVAAAPASAAEPLPTGYEFNFSAEMTHKTQSLSTLYRRKAGDPLGAIGTAPDYEGAVGVSRSGANVKVDGYDSPELSSTWTRTVNVNPMTLQFKDQIESLVGKKNDAVFYNKPAGSTVLYGCTGRHVQDFTYTLTFTFHERRNIANLILRPDPAAPLNPAAPEALVIPAASGWDHVWVVYEEDLSGNEVIKRPIYAYVEQIVEDGNFALLKIG